MVGSGVPEEFPKELTAGFAVSEARRNQNQLLERLGVRLGINSITNSAASSVDQFGDTKNTGATKQHNLQKNPDAITRFKIKGINS